MELAERPSLREKVHQLERALCGVPQLECPVRHYFAPGLFAREITIAAGAVLVGAVHRVENLAVLSKGRLVLATEDGPVEISAPHILTVKPGAKNAATALEESVWTNFYPNPTDETSIDVLCETFTESKASDLVGGPTNKQLVANRTAALKE